MRKTILVLFVTLAAPLVLVGCAGDEQADVAGLSRYTPENLSEELLLRYKATRGKAAPEAKGKAEAKGKPETQKDVDGDKENAAVAKYGDEVRSHDSSVATKGISLEEMLSAMAMRAKLVKGIPLAEVYAKMAAAVDADADLSADEKTTLKAKLKTAMGV